MNLVHIAVATTAVSFALLLIAMITGGVTAWLTYEELQVVTALTLVRVFVATIEGRNASETRLIRAFLRRVLIERRPVEESLTSLGIGSDARRLQLLGRARVLFGTRVGAVHSDLQWFVQQLWP